MENNRRNFLKKAELIGSTSLLATAAPFTAFAGKETQEVSTNKTSDKPFTLSILQTTDVHCQVHAHDELFWENDKAVFRKTGGYAHLATFLKSYRKKNPNTFLIDTGDMFQGSELSVKTIGKAMIPILNQLEYDLYLLGNWEVIYYKKAMQTLLGALNAPKVCANMYHDLGEGKKGELIFPPYHIWNVNGVKIGFLGYTDPLVPIRQSPNYSKGIIYTKPEENLAHYVDVLKNDEQCAYILMVAHLGLSQQIYLANLPECEGVNYILGKDTHERVRVPIECKYSKVVEPGAFGSHVGKLNLSIENGKVVKLSNGFRFCPPRTTPDATGNIPITNGYIFDMLPVDSIVRTGKVTGKQLKDWLEKELNNVFAKEVSERFGGWVIKFKGMQVEFNAFGEKGKRVQKAMVGNAPLDLEKNYKICACERDGDPADMLCRIKGVANAKNTLYTLHGVMRDYLIKNSPVTPTLPMAAKILDAPQTLLTQVTGVNYQFH